MDDSACRAFFAQPSNPHHRRYEALRAVFVEGRTAKEVAEQFGMAYSSLRQWLYEFRRHCQHSGDSTPFFKSRKSDGPLGPQRRPNRSR
jgi:transposase-like protein